MCRSCVVPFVVKVGRNLRFEGRHYKLAEALADGWVPSLRGEIAPVAAMSARLDDALAEAGRDSREVRRILNVSGAVTTGSSDGPLRGPVEQWVEELTELAADYGFDTFIFWGEGEDQPDRFASEVVPATRARR